MYEQLYVSNTYTNFVRSNTHAYLPSIIQKLAKISLFVRANLNDIAVFFMGQKKSIRMFFSNRAYIYTNT
jgi:hypothetical protein